MQCLTQSGSKPDLDCHSIFLIIVAASGSKPDLLGSTLDTVRQHGRHNIDFVVTACKKKEQQVSFTFPHSVSREQVKKKWDCSPHQHTLPPAQDSCSMLVLGCAIPDSNLSTYTWHLKSLCAGSSVHVQLAT